MEQNINKKIDPNFSISPAVEHESWKVMLDHLYTDLISLYEKENLLIRTELNEKITEAKVAIGSMVVGGSLLLMGLFALVATSIIVLDRFMPLWGAAALVTGVLLLVGFVMVSTAKKKLAADRMMPRQSIETLGEIKTNFKGRINEFKQHH